MELLRGEHAGLKMGDGLTPRLESSLHGEDVAEVEEPMCWIWREVELELLLVRYRNDGSRSLAKIA